MVFRSSYGSWRGRSNCRPKICARRWCARPVSHSGTCRLCWETNLITEPENIMPTLLNLVPNSAKVMATSGMAAIRLIIRHTHYPRLIPIMTSNCTSKSVAVRRRCYDFLDLLLQEWQTHSLER
ncbi:CLIP-associating protein 1-A-like [Cyprinus carpio]|uniref:CLIP-associating protein 1-A-like n=1 Tax=Cyprinus carpio TaxID=7962 RepID=A0A9Q9YMA9_CYPCA|nr:CLIP-associating protein 1-A-like [Cyprinus carpio]